MPLYEYGCRTCGEKFERQLRYEERLTQQTCPRCAGQDTVLCISVPAVVMSAGSSRAAPVCPSTGAPCGCGHAH